MALPGGDSFASLAGVQLDVSLMTGSWGKAYIASGCEVRKKPVPKMGPACFPGSGAEFGRFMPSLNTRVKVWRNDRFRVRAVIQSR